MNWKNNIVINPEILVGKPVIKGTPPGSRVYIDLLAQGWTEEEILHNYAGITREDIHACLSYASETLKMEKVYPVQEIHV